MRNKALDEVDYLWTESPRGTRRVFVYESGQTFSEYQSHATFLGFPLVHITRGVCPETGRRVVARGVIAIGRIAVGGVAIGQASAGVIGIGQASFGLLVCLAQLGGGLYAAVQAGVGAMAGIGQMVTGRVVVAQFGVGQYVLAQVGLGLHVYDVNRQDETAAVFFAPLLNLFGIG
jgi:hydrogenase maturation factor